jgi:hypothetical protein
MNAGKFLHLGNLLGLGFIILLLKVANVLHNGLLE